MVNHRPCRTVTTPFPAMLPTNSTTPAPAARTGSPAVPRRSTPRCPGRQSRSGGANGLATAGRGSSGHTQRRSPYAGPGGDSGGDSGRAGGGCRAVPTAGRPAPVNTSAPATTVTTTNRRTTTREERGRTARKAGDGDAGNGCECDMKR